MTTTNIEYIYIYYHNHNYLQLAMVSNRRMMTLSSRRIAHSNCEWNVMEYGMVFIKHWPIISKVAIDILEWWASRSS